jgi:hypothetical protein
MIIFIHSIPINILLRTTNRTAYRSSIPPDVPNSSQVAYRVPVPVPRTKANYELCDYEPKDPWLQINGTHRPCDT